MRILLADDDPATRDGLSRVFRNEGYDVILAADGQEALRSFEKDRPDILCLDIMMPGVDGFGVCRKVRSLDEVIPILFISAKGEEVDRIVGMELGADDFIVKPFGVREVVARVRSATRRLLAMRKAMESRKGTSGKEGDAEEARWEVPFRLLELEVFPSELRGRIEGRQIDFSLREVKLLELFSRNPGKVLDRILIGERCWGPDIQPTSRTIDQHIALLRKKIETNPANPRLIKTVHGAGYRFDP